MILPCSLWNHSALQALQALTSLMALEQVASASWMIQPLVVLTSLTATEQAGLASKITQEQLVLVYKVNWEQVVWIKSCLRADSFGFFDRFSCLGLVLAKFCTQFPDGSLPTGIYGCFGGQQILKGFVCICPELHCIHQGCFQTFPILLGIGGS